MDDLPIIDPHHHLYDLKTGRYPWLQDDMLERVFGDYSAIRRDYLIHDFREDIKNQNVVKSVHLQVEYDHNNPVAETRWLQNVADQHGYPDGIVAFADLSSPTVQQTIEEHCAFANVRGIRQCLNYHRDPVKTFIEHPHLMSDAQWQRGYGLLKRYDLSFDLQLPGSRALDRLREFDLDAFAHAYPAQLSGGMRQRVAFVRTMLTDAPILLLDEPFAALDALTRSDLHRWLQDVLPGGQRTVLLVTHDVEEALLLADRVLVVSPRPAQVSAEERITFTRPRRRSLTLAPEFLAAKARLLIHLGTAAPA